MFLSEAKWFWVINFIVLSLLTNEIASGPGPFHDGKKISQDGEKEPVESLDPLVDLKQGTARGKTEISRNGRIYLSFRGIPFGKTPQRFNNPVPAGKWEGILDAKEYGPSCAQVEIMSHKFRGEESCLNLNVYTPQIDLSRSNETLPVMVYIHGGAFVMGYSNWVEPKYLMDEDVIIVSLNYRVGAFGFLNAGVKGASGNQALKDMVLGLQWVKENIAAFGGDPTRVTIFGLSAGGAAVSLLVASPMAAGLFSGAISQSGVATIGWAQWPDPNFDEAKKLAQAVDCPTSNREYMVECLRMVKPEAIARATDFKDPVVIDVDVAD